MSVTHTGGKHVQQQTKKKITIVRIAGEGGSPVFLIDGGMNRSRFVRDSAGLTPTLTELGLGGNELQCVKVKIYGVLSRLDDRHRSETVML